MLSIQIENLVKTYRVGKAHSAPALNSLSLTVREGEIFSLLGPNGAGKSTLIRILTTRSPFDSGSVRVMGNALPGRARAVRGSIACVSQQVSLDRHLFLFENLLFQGTLYGLRGKAARERASELIERFSLGAYLSRPVACFSGGVLRKLDIAMSLMGSPSVLFLDEPSVGMDVQSRRELWRMIRSLRSDFGTTVFLTTHYLEEADALSDTVCIIKEGREIVQGGPEILRPESGSEGVRFSLDDVFLSLTGCPAEAI